MWLTVSIWYVQAEISTAAIVEGHVFDVDLALDKGGKINLRLKFMLTEEERQRIDMMVKFYLCLWWSPKKC